MNMVIMIGDYDTFDLEMMITLIGDYNNSDLKLCL